MTSAGNVIRHRVARVRAAASRRLQRIPVGAAERVLEVNLAPDPAFRGGTRDLYVHVHNTCDLVEIPGLPGVTGARVEGLGSNNDTHIAPGGRDAAGKFRLGMRPGRTYTASVSVHLEEPLTGALHPSALRVVPGCIENGSIRWSLARSSRARNEYGDHRISVTFTVPDDATSAWIRLHSGMSQGNGVVYWHSFSLTGTDYLVDYFDGSTPADDLYEYGWTGEPNASPSRRVLRATAQPAMIAEEAVRLAARGAAGPARALLARLDGDPLTAARVSAALGDTGTARTALQKLVAGGDPGGDAAYELGLLDLQRRSWAAAESRFADALAKRPDDPRRAYRLASAYDGLKRRDDSKRAAAAGVPHDPGLPFDGKAVLDLDVKSFGARRDLGVFIAEHLDQIRTQAEHRLARPVATTFDQPIFVYWAQGFDAAPPLVRSCLAALKANNPGERVHELSDATISAYVDVPDDVTAALADDKTHFSDLLRLLLLEKFGGVWLDATCYVTEPLRPHLADALAKASVFAFNYHGPYISSWLIASRPGSYPMHLWRAACLLWWEKGRGLIDYFLIHHVFEMLYHLDERFRAEWDAGLRLNSRPPHALQAVMLQPYDPDAFRTILAGSFAHKLRYKYEQQNVTSESYLARIIRGDLSGPG